MNQHILRYNSDTKLWYCLLCEVVSKNYEELKQEQCPLNNNLIDLRND